jgi:hypothetical protein
MLVISVWKQDFFCNYSVIFSIAKKSKVYATARQAGTNRSAVTVSTCRKTWCSPSSSECFWVILCGHGAAFPPALTKKRKFFITTE